MGQLTEYARQANKNRFRKKLRQQQDAPEWLTGAGTWVAMAAVIVGLVAVIGYGIFNRPTSTVADAPAHHGPNHHVGINPATLQPTPSSQKPSPTKSESSAPKHDRDFNDPSVVNVPVDGSKAKAPVPAGARNVALAGITSYLSGDWSGVPLAGSPPQPPKDLQGGQVVDSSLRVKDPEKAGTNPYYFVCDVRTAEGTEPVTVKVGYGTTSYRVVPN